MIVVNGKKLRVDMMLPTVALDVMFLSSYLANRVK